MAKLGAQVEMFGCVGDDDNGRKMVENLQANGVETSHSELHQRCHAGRTANYKKTERINTSP